MPNSLRRILLVSLLVLISACAQLPQQRRTGAVPDDLVHITLIHVNDVYQMGTVDKGSRGGLARLATLKRQAAAAGPTLMLLGGDTLSPSVASTLFKGRQMIAAWNAAGLDYAVLGNHEFDFGPDVFRERLAESGFTWLGANVVERSGRTLVAPYAIREIGGVKIGFVGVVTPDTVRASKPGPDLQFRDPIASARAAVLELEKRGVHTIIGMTHLMLQEDKALAHAIRFDAILGGHEHTLLQAEANGVPILKMGSDARIAGRLDLAISRRTGETWSVDWELVPVTADIPDDPATAAVIATYEQQLSKALDQPLARTAVALDARQDSNRSRETNLGSFLADAYRAHTGADLALINGGSIRSNTEYGPGPITKRDILSILPFENPIIKVQATGAIVRAALEHGFARAEQPEVGEFPQLSGMRVVFDPRRPAGSRVVRVTVGGAPLEDDKKYTLALSSYLASGGDGYAMLKGLTELITMEEAQVEPDVVLAAFNSADGTVSPETDGRIQKAGE
jgi:5'-nucleotidase